MFEVEWCVSVMVRFYNIIVEYFVKYDEVCGCCSNDFSILEVIVFYI